MPKCYHFTEYASNGYYVCARCGKILGKFPGQGECVKTNSHTEKVIQIILAIILIFCVWRIWYITRDDYNDKNQTRRIER